MLRASQHLLHCGDDMRPLRATESVEHYLARQWRLARVVSRPVYAAADGRLMLIAGEPDPVKMFRYLSHLGDGPRHVVTPSDLGYAGGSVEPLSKGKLAAASRALTKLQHSRTLLRGSRGELEALRTRLPRLHDWRRRAMRGQLADSPWLLDEKQERQLTEVLERHEGLTLNSQSVWFARLVMWCSGPQALVRFCQATPHLPRPTCEADARPLLRASLAKLEVWTKRAQTEHWKAIRWEVKEWISRLPPRVASRAGLSSKLQRDNIFQQLEDQRFRCNQALRECDDGGRPLLLAAAATLTACDRDGVRLPTPLLRYWSSEANRHRVSASCVALAKELGAGSYARLLGFLNAWPETSPSDYPLIRSFYDRGEGAEDIAWVLREGLQDRFFNKALRPGWARRQIDGLRAAGIKLDGWEASSVLSAATDENGAEAVAGFVGWVRSLPNAARTPRLCRLMKTVLLGPYFKALSNLGLHEPLRNWLSAVRRRSQREGTGRLEAWERCVAQARTASNALEAPARKADVSAARRCKRRLEYEYLRSLVDKGRATPPQRARCEHLRPETEGARSLNQARLLRSLQKSYVVASVDALLRSVRAGAESLLVEDLAARLAHHRFARVLDFAVWTKEMTTEQRGLLAAILLSHRLCGDQYKLRFPDNVAWIEKARRAGVDTRAWLSPEPWNGVVAGKRVSIAVSMDPVETFLMGDYFGTCLSLGDCNQMSVLANAADANKHVLYARDRSGRILARKLIAVSKDWGLLGYYCYGKEDNSAEGENDSLTEAVTKYCGEIAQRCGLLLINDGEPETIGARFWYDDGPTAWGPPAPEPPAPLVPVLGGVVNACHGVV